VGLIKQNVTFSLQRNQRHSADCQEYALRYSALQSCGKYLIKNCDATSLCLLPHNALQVEHVCLEYTKSPARH